MNGIATSPLTTLGIDSFDLSQRAPLLFEHRLHEHAYFQRHAIAELIERYPRQHYSIVHTGERGGQRTWREGEFGGLAGERVLEAIERGRLWLNMRNGQEVDPQLRSLLMQIYAEAHALAPPAATFHHSSGILVSSPGAQVYYHADLPGQGLLQLHGRKRIYIYPPRQPFLTHEGLENIALKQLEVGLHYEPAFDAEAEVFDLEPGQGLFWPLNSPHRIENHDCLNISMTVEYWTEEIRRRHIVNLANGILRHYFKQTPRARQLAGPSFYAKAALQSLWRRSGRLNSLRKAMRPIDFRLDPDVPGRIIDTLGASAQSEHAG